MDILETIELNDCPLCLGAGLLDDDGNSVSASCLDCGCRTVFIPYKNDAEKLDAAQRIAFLWNTGKVIAEGVGE